MESEALATIAATDGTPNRQMLRSGLLRCKMIGRFGRFPRRRNPAERQEHLECLVDGHIEEHHVAAWNNDDETRGWIRRGRDEHRDYVAAEARLGLGKVFGGQETDAPRAAPRKLDQMFTPLAPVSAASSTSLGKKSS